MMTTARVEDDSIALPSMKVAEFGSVAALALVAFARRPEAELPAGSNALRAGVRVAERLEHPGGVSEG